MSEILTPEQVEEIRQMWGRAPTSPHIAHDVHALCDTVERLRAAQRAWANDARCTPSTARRRATMTESEVHRTMSFDYVLPSKAARDAFEDKAFEWFHDATEKAGGQCDGASAGPFESDPWERLAIEFETLRGIAQRLADGWKPWARDQWVLAAFNEGEAAEIDVTIDISEQSIVITMRREPFVPRELRGSDV